MSRLDLYGVTERRPLFRAHKRRALGTKLNRPLARAISCIGAQKRARSHKRDPCIGSPFESWFETCFAVPGTKKEMARLREPCFVLVPRRCSVTRARPRHPLHRMPFESWREACFAVPGIKKEMARLREPCFVLVPRRGLEPPHLAAHGPEPCASTNSAIWA
jgi:hypothetical protein